MSYFKVSWKKKQSRSTFPSVVRHAVSTESGCTLLPLRPLNKSGLWLTSLQVQLINDKGSCSGSTKSPVKNNVY